MFYIIELLSNYTTLYENVLHIFLVSYNKQTSKNVHFQVDDFKLLDITNTLYEILKP